MPEFIRTDFHQRFTAVGGPTCSDRILPSAGAKPKVASVTPLIGRRGLGDPMTTAD